MVEHEVRSEVYLLSRAAMVIVLRNMNVLFVDNANII